MSIIKRNTIKMCTIKMNKIKMVHSGLFFLPDAPIHGRHESCGRDADDLQCIKMRYQNGISMMTAIRMW